MSRALVEHPVAAETIEECFRLKPRDYLSPSRGFSSFTPTLSDLGYRMPACGFALLPNASFYNAEEKALGAVLYKAAVSAIELGDVTRLKELVPDFWSLELEKRRINDECERLVFVAKLAQGCVDFYKRLEVFLRSYSLPPEEKIADVLRYITPDSRHPEPGKIRSYEELVEIFKLVVAKIEKMSLESYRALEDVSILDAAELAKDQAQFSAELKLMLSGISTIPVMYAALEKPLAADEDSLSRAVESSPDKVKARYVLLREKELSSELRAMTPVAVLAHNSLLEASVKNYCEHIAEMNVELSATETSVERKKLLAKQILLYQAALQTLTIQQLILTVFVEPPKEKEHWRLPVTLSELRLNIQDLFNFCLEISIENFKITLANAGSDLDAALRKRFESAFKGKLSAIIIELNALDFDTDMESYAIASQMNKLKTRVEQLSVVYEKQSADYAKLSLTQLEKAAELDAELAKARVGRYRLLMTHPEPGAELRARDREVEGFEKNLRLAFSGTRQAQIHHLLNVALAPNASNELGETLIFHVLRATLAPEIKMTLLQHLVKQGALISVQSREGLYPGALVLTDKACLNYLYQAELASRRSLAALDEVDYVYRLNLEVERGGASLSWSAWSCSFFAAIFLTEAQYVQRMLECLGPYQARTHRLIVELQRRVAQIETETRAAHEPEAMISGAEARL